MMSFMTCPSKPYRPDPPRSEDSLVQSSPSPLDSPRRQNSLPAFYFFAHASKKLSRAPKCRCCAFACFRHSANLGLWLWSAQRPVALAGNDQVETLAAAAATASAKARHRIDLFFTLFFIEPAPAGQNVQSPEPLAGRRTSAAAAPSTHHPGG
jgi:hypothetical protein